ncbi:MAG: histidine phosphatase family protein, partial [bacterium]|nr:histidine phosphatase family protein [bacterium]
MKTLLLMRHGKSSWENSSLADFDRPLKKRGERAAAAIGREIQRRGLLPDLVLSSAAKRARETANIAVQSAGIQAPVDFTEDLYGTGLRGYLAVLAEVDDSHKRVLLVAHNPDIEDLVEHLTGESVTMPTAALVQVEL